MTQSGTKLEKDFQKEVIQYLTQQGAYVIKTHVSAYQSQGEPDITCCYLGRYLAFELKKDSHSYASKLQKYKMKQIQEAGGIAMRVDNLDQIKGVLYEISRVQQGGKS